jgi:hypothetical protein
MFCGIITNTEDDNYGKFDYELNVADGRYDIITEDRGREILIIDTANVGGETTRRCRRLTSQYD